MHERTLYFSSDGFAFSTPELCLEYERQRSRWTAAMEEVPLPEEFQGPGKINLDLDEWLPQSPYREGVLRTEQEARGFLERLSYLQRLAAFMAESDTEKLG